jgi:pimeloyl-ACP methyl ester carboxylesterase
MTLLEQMLAMPTQGVALPWQGFVRYRQSVPHADAAKATPMVLLHGIGSGSGSWLHQLQAAKSPCFAWDAPGYADTSVLKNQEPVAADYARVLWAWLDALKIERVHLVGHSLGCIMAASAARLQPARVEQISLLAPAQGYGPAPEAVRNSKRDERLQAMAQLGLQKMAQQRAPRLLSAQASAEQVELATHMMSRLNEGGYAQATQMLSSADIRADLQAFKAASSAVIRIACGEQDIITPPAACQALAEAIHAPYTSIAGAGHACALEAPAAVNAFLNITSPAHHG